MGATGSVYWTDEGENAIRQVCSIVQSSPARFGVSLVSAKCCALAKALPSRAYSHKTTAIHLSAHNAIHSESEPGRAQPCGVDT